LLKLSFWYKYYLSLTKRDMENKNNDIYLNIYYILIDNELALHCLLFLNDEAKIKITLLYYRMSQFHCSVLKSSGQSKKLCNYFSISYYVNSGPELSVYSNALSSKSAHPFHTIVCLSGSQPNWSIFPNTQSRVGSSRLHMKYTHTACHMRTH